MSRRIFYNTETGSVVELGPVEADRRRLVQQARRFAGSLSAPGMLDLLNALTSQKPTKGVPTFRVRGPGGLAPMIGLKHFIQTEHQKWKAWIKANPL